MKNLTRRMPLAALSLAVFSHHIPVLAQSREDSLSATVVTATRFEEPAQMVPYGASILTSDDIRASGARTVNEAIIRLLGVPGRLDTTGGGNYTLDLRGFGSTADRNQVVIVDGRRLRLDDLSATNLSVVPIEAVERIEVMRGNGSVQYGEGATGGAIVITTKAGKGVQRTNAVTMGVAAGSDALREAHTSAVLVSGPWSVDVTAKDTKSDGHRDNFASDVNNLGTTLQWSSDWLRAGVTMDRQMMISGWPGGLSASQFDANPRQATSLVNYGSSKTENGGAFVRAEVGQWELAADMNSQTKTVRNYSYSADVTSMNANFRARQERDWNGRRNGFVVGVDTAQWSTLASGKLSDSQSSALYVTDDLTLVGGATRLSAGVRTESVDKKSASSVYRPSEHPLSWNLGLSQRVASAVTVYGRTGNSYRLPVANEFTFTVPGATLQMQTSRDNEMGVRWMDASTSAELRWYRNEIDNELGYDPVIANPNSFSGKGANVNFDPTRHQGVELEAKSSLTPSFKLRGGAAVREAKFVAGPYAGNDIALVPHQTVSVGASWQPMAGHWLDASVNWVDKYSVDFQNKCSVPAYTTVDARYAYSTRGLEWFVSVKNLTDLKYFTQAYTCSNGVTGSIYPEAGRAVVTGMVLRF